MYTKFPFLIKEIDLEDFVNKTKSPYSYLTHNTEGNPQ
jgi:hypothetical protein